MTSRREISRRDVTEASKFDVATWRFTSRRGRGMENMTSRRENSTSRRDREGHPRLFVPKHLSFRKLSMYKLSTVVEHSAAMHFRN